MRDRIWNNLSSIKFQSKYLDKISRKSHNFGNIYSFFLAFTTASSVATWAIWEKSPLIWATIVGISQILQIGKPYIPFIKNEREFIEMSLLFESLYLSYEKLWFDNEKLEKNEQIIEEQFYELRRKELDVNTQFKHIVCPEFKKLINEVNIETDNFLKTNFTVGDNHAR